MICLQRTSLFLSVLLISGLCGAGNNVPPSWSHQGEVRPQKAGLTEVTVPLDMLDHASPSLHDLRLFRPSGEEIPYSLNQPFRTPARWVKADSFKSALDDTTTVLTGNGPSGTVDAIRAESPAGAFLKSMALDVYEKGRWKNLWEGQPIYRTSLGPQNLELEFPARRLTRFQIRVDDQKNVPVPFTGVTLRMAADEVPPVQKIPAVLSGREDRPCDTHVTVSLPSQHLYVDGLTIETSDPLFQRSARVVIFQVAREANPGGGQQIIELPLGESTLYRAPDENGTVSENVFIPINRRIPAREIHLMITNGDAPPLKIQSVTVHQIPTRLLFFATDLLPLTLAGGHPGAPVPRYDWPLTRAKPVPATVGKIENNPAYVKPDVVPLLASVGATFTDKGWGYRSTIEVKTAGVQSLEIPLPVLMHSLRDGRDLRLIRDGRQIPFVYDRTGSYHVIDPERTPVLTAPKGTTRWEIKLPTKGIPISHLELRAKESLFQRPVHVYEERLTGNGDRYSRSFAETLWHRDGKNDRLILSLVGSPEGDRIFLDIQDGDNAPLTLESVKLYYRTYALVFKTDRSSPLWLYYGQPEASFPIYDAALVADELLSAEKSKVVLGPEEKLKSRWVWGTPSHGETSALFWAVLAAVTVVLLLVIQRLLPDLKAKP